MYLYQAGHKGRVARRSEQFLKAMVEKAIVRRLEVSRATIVVSRAICAYFFIFRRPVPAADVEMDVFPIVSSRLAFVSLRDLQAERRRTFTHVYEDGQMPFVFYRERWTIEFVFYRERWTIEFVFYRERWTIEFVFYRERWTIEFVFYRERWTIEFVFYRERWTIEFVFYRERWTIEFVFYRER